MLATGGLLVAIALLTLVVLVPILQRRDRGDGGATEGSQAAATPKAA